AEQFVDLLYGPAVHLLHRLYPLLQERFELPDLIGIQAQFLLEAFSKPVTHLCLRRPFPLLFPGLTPANDCAGNSAGDEDRRQVEDDFPFGQVFHGYRLMRMAESAMATGPGSPSFQD